MARALLRVLKNLNKPNHMRPGRWPRFYLAVQIERRTSAPRCDISLLRTKPHTSMGMRFMRTPIAHRCIGKPPSNRRAPAANRAPRQRCGRQSDSIVSAAKGAIYRLWRCRFQFRRLCASVVVPMDSTGRAFFGPAMRGTCRIRKSDLNHVRNFFRRASPFHRWFLLVERIF